jgi:hypothetical protein
MLKALGIDEIFPNHWAGIGKLGTGMVAGGEAMARGLTFQARKLLRAARPCQRN